MPRPQAVTVAASDAVPVLDLELWEAGDVAEQQAAARELAGSLEQVGFLLLRGHGVPAEVLDELVAVAREFFDLPLEEKMRVHRQSGGDPGYYPPASSSLAASIGAAAPPDLKEGFGVAPLRRGEGEYFSGPEAERWFPPNRWPDRPAGLRTACEQHFSLMAQVCDRVLRVFAVGLGLPVDHFAAATRRHTSTAAVLHYPPQPVPPEPGQLRAGAHSDYGTLTVLHKAGNARGLQVQRPGGGWADVVPPPGHLIVNIGDLMSAWTGGRWVSTMHRVVNPPAGANELGDVSVPFFHQPDYDVLVRPFDAADDEYAVTAGRHLADKVDRMHAKAGA